MQDEEGNDRTNNATRHSTAQNGEKDIIPTKRDILVDAAEIAGGIIFGGIAVALAEAGFHFWSFVVGFMAVGCGLLVLAHLIEKLGLKYVKSGLVTLLVLMAILFLFLAIHKPTPETKASPHFKFSLFVGDATNDAVELTNAFLFVKHPEEGFPLIAVLCLPTQLEQSNVVINLMVQNDSSVLAENAEVSFSIEPYMGCVPSFGWEPNLGKSYSGYVTSSGSAVTNAKSAWSIRIPAPILPGDGMYLPSFQIKTPLDTNTFSSLGIVVKAKDSSPEAFAADLLFIASPSNKIHPFKPFVIHLRKNPNGLGNVDIRPEINKRLLE